MAVITMDNDQYLNSVIVKSEKLAMQYINKLPMYLRDDVLQEVRIRVWHLFDSFSKNQENINKDEFEKYILDNIRGIVRSTQSLVSTKYHRQNARCKPIDIIPESSLAIEPVQYKKRSAEYSRKTLEKLMSCLNEREKFIVNYMIIVNNICDNYDQLMRQLGYTGKGSVKYIIEGIKKKIKQYAEDNGLTVDL